ncbi:hypothetical protein BX616_006166, partial [Lobosporangium transversale]
WPSAEAEGLTAATWISDFGGVIEGETLSNKLMFVERQATGKIQRWIRRWRMTNKTNGAWSQFVSDFIMEASTPRSQDVTLDELHSIKQGEDETTANYVQRMKLTMELLDPESGCDAQPYKIPTATERLLAYRFCKGLRQDHPFKVKNKEAPATLKETFESVTQLVEGNRWGIDTTESRVIARSNAEHAAPIETNVLLGSTLVPRTHYSGFLADFKDDKEKVNQLSVDELTDMFGAWTLAAEERTPEARIAQTISRMSPAVARRVFGSSELAKHIRVEARPNAVLQPAEVRSQQAIPMARRTCHKCNQEGHLLSFCPLVECFRCGERGHTSKVCTKEQGSPATGANSVPLATQTNSSLRVQSLEISATNVAQSFITTKPQRLNSTGAQRRRSERTGTPAGPSSQRREETRGTTPPVRGMQWEAEASTSSAQPSGDPHFQTVTFDDRAVDGRENNVAEAPNATPKRTRKRVIPDPVFVDAVEGLNFDLATHSKYRGKMAVQLKAAVTEAWARHAPPRRSKPKRSQSAIAMARNVQGGKGDVTTVTALGRDFNNAVIDPGNDHTMMGLHVANALGLKLEPATRAVLLAHGSFQKLAGRTRPIDIYVSGIPLRMSMGVIDCKGTYDFLLGDDWLKALKAKADWSNGIVYYVESEGRTITLGGGLNVRASTPQPTTSTYLSDENDEYDDEYDDYEDDESIYETEESDADAGYRALRVKTIEVGDPDLQAMTARVFSSKIQCENDDARVKRQPFAVDGVNVDINPNLSNEQYGQIVELLERNKDRLTTNLEDLEVT